MTLVIKKRSKNYGKLTVRCVGCKTQRTITLNQAAKGQPFCPKCGNMEVAIRASS